MAGTVTVTGGDGHSRHHDGTQPASGRLSAAAATVTQAVRVSLAGFDLINWKTVTMKTHCQAQATRNLSLRPALPGRRRGGAWQALRPGARGPGTGTTRMLFIWILADVLCRTSDVRHSIIPTRMLHTMSYVVHVRHRTRTMSYIVHVRHSISMSYVRHVRHHNIRCRTCIQYRTT